MAADPILSAPMDDQPLFDELLHAAARLGVEVRMGPFETPATLGGGLCIVRGETLVLIDQRAPLPDRAPPICRGTFWPLKSERKGKPLMRTKDRADRSSSQAPTEPVGCLIGLAGF